MSAYPEKLARNFTYRELVRSHKAESLKLKNDPPDELLLNAKASADLAQECRDYLGKLLGKEVFFEVTSWYRSPEVNTAVGGSGSRPGEKPSAHMRALAMDFIPINVGVTDAFHALRHSKIGFDKLIWETDGASVWIHLQAAPPGVEPRRECYTGTKGVFGQKFRRMA